MTDIVPADSRALNLSDELSFAELLEVDQHYKLKGLTKAAKGELMGVPLIVTGITWWVSDIPNKDFVALEAVVGNYQILAETVRLGRVSVLRDGKSSVITDVEELVVHPEERIVFNDGSTGVRRQVTQLCHAEGLINVGTVASDSDYDKSFMEWDSFNEFREQGSHGNVPTVTKNRNGQPFILRALRGLYLSEYTNEYGKGMTYYLR